MDSMTALARAYIKSLATKEEMLALLDKLLLSENEFKVLKGVYLNQQSLSYIADELGYSIQNVKIIHKKALTKVASFIQRSINL